MAFKIKRAYEPASSSDGSRILVDRLWPRGVKKSTAHLCCWMNDIAPSPKLRLWFGHRPQRFVEFRRCYERELSRNVVMSKLRESGRGRISHPRLWRAGSSHQSCLRSSRRPARRFPDFRSPSTANSRARRQTIANQSRCITFQEVSSCISYS